MSSRYEQILQKEQRWKRRLYRWLPNYRFSNDFFEDIIKGQLQKDVRWVDLGCGKNALVDEFQECGATAIGLDRIIHPELNPAANAPFIRGDVAQLPFKDDSIDLFSSNVLMEHLPDPQRALNEMHRCLKPGGAVIFRTPNARHILNVLLRFIPAGWKKRLLRTVFGVSPDDVFPTYYRANRLRDLHRLCRETGFAQYHVQAVEDVHTAFGFFFFLSLLYYAVVRWKPLAFLRTNFIVTAKKGRIPRRKSHGSAS